MAIAVTVENLSKEYRIRRTQSETMLRERLVGLVKRAVGRETDAIESVWALRDVSFEVEQGQVLGIVGRNGAGKSTLLKVLSRITYPTSGRMSVRGRVASLLEVGTGFHDELTGRENVFLNGSILGMTRAEIQKKFDAIVDFSGIERFLDTPIKRYSSGMRVRLGFAVAAHVDPDVLIVDEVLAVGDAGFQKKCLDAMQEMRSGGRTVLFVSHQMAAVENLCSRALWIDRGQVRLDGPVRAVIGEYMASFSAPGGETRDFERIEHRSGSGKVRYTGIEFFDEAGQVKNVIRCGESVTLRLSYRAREPVPSASFGVRLFTELGTLVTDISTWINGIEIESLEAGEGQVEVRIPSLTLAAARYSLSLFITEGTEFTLCDELAHCTHIDVEVADVFGSGRPMLGQYGITYFSGQRWTLNGREIGRLSEAGR